MARTAASKRLDPDNAIVGEADDGVGQQLHGLQKIIGHDRIENVELEVALTARKGHGGVIAEHLHTDLGQGLTLQQVADEFEVHINSVEHWKQCWIEFGLAGLYEGHHRGRPPSLSPKEETTLRKLAKKEGGTSRSLLTRLSETLQWPVSRDTVRRCLRRMGVAV